VIAAALVERARSLCAGGRRAVLGITGPPGAGKTTFARDLVDELNSARGPASGRPWAVHVPMDGFHLADVQLDALGRRDRKGAPDTFDAAGYAALLHRINDNHDQVVYAPAFDRGLEQPIAGSIAVPPGVRLVVTEGNYLLLGDTDWEPVHRELAQTWYCDIPADERVRRLVARHHQFGKALPFAQQWVLSVDEPNARIVEASRDRADLVLSPQDRERQNAE
jgi:pantothenate kinase